MSTHPLATFRAGATRNSRFKLRYFGGCYHLSTPVDPGKRTLRIVYRPTVLPPVSDSFHLNLDWR